jgi:hypothetical protein
MGIKNFSKVFGATRLVKPKDLNGKTIAIDAMTELYRAALGAKSVSTLTDSSGNPTIHISVILSNVLEFHRNNVNQIWVFDHNQNPDLEFHNPSKLGELMKRKKRKDLAAAEMKTLKDFQKEEPMFSDDEEEPNTVVKTKNATDSKATDKSTVNKDNKDNLDDLDNLDLDNLTTKDHATNTNEDSDVNSDDSDNSNADAAPTDVADRIASLEKRTFSANTEMINDVKLILSCLGIWYTEAPAGFEGEELASYLNSSGLADAVYSGDTDPIAYGAKVLLRRNPRDKKIYEYTQEDILKQITENSSVEDPTLADIRKAAIALGTDLIEKTPGVGAKTVLKKLHMIKLTPKQKTAMKEFEKEPTEEQFTIYNKDKTPFGPDCTKQELIDWLVDVKSFNRSRIVAQFEKKATGNKAPVKKTETKKKPSARAVKKTAVKKVSKKSGGDDVDDLEDEEDLEDETPAPIKYIPIKRGANKAVSLVVTPIVSVTPVVKPVSKHATKTPVKPIAKPASAPFQPVKRTSSKVNK